MRVKRERTHDDDTAQDRFYNTDLDKALQAKGIKTLIMVGWKISGSVTYT